MTYGKVPEEEPVKYEHQVPMISSHSCTDPICGGIFIVFLCYGAYIMSYAFQNGDPRKVYHGMDYEGRLCGVDLPYKPYVYWCKTSEGNSNQIQTGSDSVQSLNGTAAWIQPIGLDFVHPICVETCPQSAASESKCYDQQTGGTRLLPDYATHAVAKMYCFPQAQGLMDKVNDKMSAHPHRKYLPLVISAVRTNWAVLLGALVLALILSSIYILLLESFSGCVIWVCLITMVVLPGACGGFLIYASQNGGIDGMPGSGDAQTDLHAGIFCCVMSAFFLLMCCWMRNAIAKAIQVVEEAATCLFECKSLLFEPLINLATRMILWTTMLVGLAYLISVGEVRKSKIYRTFTYTDEEYIYLASYVFLILWVNEFCNAMSQYVIASASATWYFTEHSLGCKKSVGSCLLLQGYCGGMFWHFGSLALGSCMISLLRPLRICVMLFVLEEEIVDIAVCGCITKCCGCCVECFNSFLVHLSKNAYIDMAITGKNFCASGTNAVELLQKQSKTLIATAGATWIFTLVGLASVTASGSFITSLVVKNVEVFNRPTSRHYVQDPMVCSAIAGVICWVVALGFMLAFDSVSDTMVLCLAYDREEEKSNPKPVPKPTKVTNGTFAEHGAGFMSALMSGKPAGIGPITPQKQQEIVRPQYCPDKMKNW